MDQIFVGVGVIVEKDGKFLVVEEASGKYSFPGGHVMNNEKIENAAIREVFEESKVNIEVEYIVGFYLIPGALGIGIKSKYISHEEFSSTEEIKQIFWMTPEEIETNESNFRPGQLLGYKDYKKECRFELSIIQNLI